jgi:hypothetical protein
MPDPHQISAGIVAGAHQITHRLDLRSRKPYCGDLTQPQQPGQMRGVPGIGLDAISGRALQLRRGGDQAIHPGAVVDRSSESKAGGTRLVSHSHRATKLM